MLTRRSRAKDSAARTRVRAGRSAGPRVRGDATGEWAMMFFSRTLRRILSKVPGEKRLGVYRFLPVFFVMGGGMEWIMINMRIGRETFYDVYRRKQSERCYQQHLDETSQSSDSD